MKHSLLGIFGIATILGLSGCSEPVKTKSADAEVKQEPKGPPQPVSAKTAFWEVYKPAHAWAADLQAVSIKSGEVASVKNETGKAGLWTISVVSPSLRQARTYHYAVADELPQTVKGIKLGQTLPWGGPTSDAVPIRTSDFSTDSDAAYNTAMSKADAWLKKHPDMPVSMVLGSASRFPAPVWYVLWGSKKSGYEVFINASDGTIYK